MSWVSYISRKRGKVEPKNSRKPSDPENVVSLPAHLQVSHTGWMGELYGRTGYNYIFSGEH